MDGNEHAFHRRLMNLMFTASYMAHYLPIMHRVIMRRTQDWAERGEVELCEEARKVTFDIAAEALVGFTTGPTVDHFRRLFARLLRANPNAITAQMLLDVLEVKTVLMPLLSRRIRARRGARTNDLLGLLANLRDENGELLSVTQVLGHLNILLVAGHETLTSLIAWLLYSLASHPEHLARVRNEIRGQQEPTTPESLRAMKNLGNAVKETERLYPPVSNRPGGSLNRSRSGVTPSNPAKGSSSRYRRVTRCRTSGTTRTASTPTALARRKMKKRITLTP